MRPIKFRAWNKEIKRMVYDIQKEYDTIAGLVYEGTDEEPGESCFNGYLIDEKYEVMQFTGLLDKNGKEIYAGDILEGGEPIDGEPRRGVIEWATTNYTAHYNFGILPSHIYCKIIGNIYENSNLSEVER